MDNIWFNRYYEFTDEKLFVDGKVLVVIGPRRVGKTSLIKKLINKLNVNVFEDSGDNLDFRRIISSESLQQLSSAFNPFDIIFIDEAQRIPNIGYSVKLLIDQFPEKKIILSGSSSLDLAGQLGEPLTGRQKKKILFPIGIIEINHQYGGIKSLQILNELLIYGSYPEVLKQNSFIDKKEYLLNLRDSYLLKDILELEELKHSEKLFDLLKLLAFQIGSEVSINELSKSLGIAKQSVERYISLLEKSYVIKRVGGFSRNLRSEVTKSSRFYFLDNGIRNAIINNFNMPENRNDMGMLWENLMITERIKKQEYLRLFSNNYFWRTYEKQEIDLIEERDGKLFAFEFKYGKAKVKTPKQWINAYPDSEFKVINPNNFLEFLS